MFKTIIPIASLMMLCLSCTGSRANQSETTQADTETNTPKLESAPFDADSAYSFVADQVLLGARTPGSTAHKKCGDWIVSKLRSWGYDLTEQTFTGKDYFGQSVQGRNIIATKNRETSAKRILLMAHWDTRQVADQDANSSARSQAILGADDGASGVGVLLELARQNALLDEPLALDFVFFDLEDGGQEDEDSWCQGSQYWAKTPHSMGYKADYGILLDMVGARGAKFCWEAYSKSYAAPLLSKLWDTARLLGWSEYFIQRDGGSLIDDHVPVIKYRGIPSVDIVNYSPDHAKGFGDHWHTQKDNMSIIDKATLKAVGQTVATTLTLIK